MNRYKVIICLLFTVILSVSEFYGGTQIVFGEEADVKDPGQLYALSAVLMDGDTGRVLYEKDGYTVRANASTTKILTCILALESGKLDELVTVSKYAASMPDVQLGIVEGEQYILKDLLYSLMLESHNDVAVAIAEHVSGSVEQFSELMNRKAKELGCTDTYFITPNGLDASKDTNEGIKIHGTTANDLAKIMCYCIKNQEFLKITQTSSYTFSSRIIDESGAQRIGGRKYTVSNKNAFLNMMDGVISGKTGFTNDAGYCYVCALESEGRRFVVALLGCGWPNNKTYKWSDSKKLLNYGMCNYQKKDYFDYGQTFDDIPVHNGVLGDYDKYGKNGIYDNEIPYVSVYMDESSLELLTNNDEIIKKEVNISNKLEAPVYEGQVIGYVRYIIDDIIIKEYKIKAGDTVEKKDWKWSFMCVINKFIMH